LWQSKWRIITLVFDAGNLQKTYEDTKSKGIEIEPPRTAVWDGDGEIVQPK